MIQRLKRLEGQIRILQEKYFCFSVSQKSEEDKILMELERDYPHQEKLCVFITKYEWD